MQEFVINGGKGSYLYEVKPNGKINQNKKEEEQEIKQTNT